MGGWRERERERDRQTDRQTDRQRQRQRDRQIDRQTDRERERERERERSPPACMPFIIIYLTWDGSRTAEYRTGLAAQAVWYLCLVPAPVFVGDWRLASR